MARARDNSKLTRTSRFIALVLRHKPQAAGIEVDEHGWANVDELIAGISAAGHPLDRATLDLIVATDEKGRYSYSDDGKRIRANQGHSIHVDVELEETMPPDTLFHGTATRFLESIDDKGLWPGNRLYVHLSSDEQTATKVGSRHGVPVVLRVEAGRMASDGFVFYRSANGVWLTKFVPREYLVFPD